jgi:predicted DCC family thiol-disulfide oxidoreductase YuxK
VGCLVAGLRFFPRRGRDYFYRWVARWRRRVFGVGQVAVLYALAEGGRFLL